MRADINRLAQAWHEHRFTLILGPQIYDSIKLPQPNALLKELLNEVRLTKDQVLNLKAWQNAGDWTRVAEFMLRNQPQRYERRLRAAYDCRPGFEHRFVPSFLRMVAAMAPERVFTTQIDNLMSLLLPEHEQITWSDLNQRPTPDSPMVLYLQGCVTELDSLVLGLKQTRNYEGDAGMPMRYLLHTRLEKDLVLAVGFPPQHELRSRLNPESLAVHLDENAGRDHYADHSLADLTLGYQGVALAQFFQELAPLLGIEISAHKAQTKALEPIEEAFQSQWLTPDGLAKLVVPTIDEVRAYYRGSLPDWAMIYYGYSVQRSETEKVLTQFAAGHQTVLLLGASGEGKSTILFQVGVQLVQQGYRVHNAHQVDDQLITQVRRGGGKLALLLNQAERIPRLDYLLQCLHQRQDGSRALLGARPHEWDHARRHRPNRVDDLAIVEVSVMSHHQLFALAEKLIAAGLEEKIDALNLSKKLKGKTARSLFAAMLEVTHGPKLHGILQNMVDQIATWANGSALIDALAMVSYLEHFEITCTPELFAGLFNLKMGQLMSFCAHLRGEVTLKLDRHQVHTRNLVIANALFSVLFRGQAPRVVETEIGEKIFWAVGQVLAQNHRAFEQNLLTILPKKYIDSGRDEEAEALLKIAVQVSPNNAPIWQVWALLAKKVNRLGSLEVPNTARWLFQRAVEADPTHAPSWQAWALLEAEHGNIGSIDTANSARFLFQRAVEADPTHAPSWQAWALLEAKEGHIGSIDAVNSARFLFQRAVEVDPSDAPSWQAWALLEAKEGHIGSIDAVNSARFLFQRAVEADPSHAPSWQAWAYMEWEAGFSQYALGLLSHGMAHCPQDKGLRNLAQDIRQKPQPKTHIPEVALELPAFPEPRSQYDAFLHAQKIAQSSDATLNMCLHAFDGLLPLLVQPCLELAQCPLLDEDPVCILPWPLSDSLSNPGMLVFLATAQGRLYRFTLPDLLEDPECKSPDLKEVYHIEGFRGRRDHILGLYAFPSALSQTPDLVLAARIDGKFFAFQFNVAQNDPPLKGNRLPSWMTICPVQFERGIQSLPTEAPSAWASSAVWNGDTLFWTSKETGSGAYYGDFIHKVGEHLLTIKMNQSISAVEASGSNSKKLWRWFTERQALCLAPLNEENTFLIGQDGGFLCIAKIMNLGWGESLAKALTDKIKSLGMGQTLEEQTRWAKKFFEADLSRWPFGKRAPKLVVLRTLMDTLLSASEPPAEALMSRVAMLFRRLYYDQEFIWLMPPLRSRIRSWKNAVPRDGAAAICSLYRILPYSQQDIVDLEIQRHILECEPKAPIGHPSDLEAYRILVKHAHENRRLLLEKPDLLPQKRAALMAEAYIFPWILAYTTRVREQEPDGVLRRCSPNGPLYWILKDRLYRVRGTNLGGEGVKALSLELPLTPIVRLAVSIDGKPGLFLANSQKMCWFHESTPNEIHCQNLPETKRLQLAQGVALEDNKVLLVFSQSGASANLEIMLWDMAIREAYPCPMELHAPSELAVSQLASDQWLLASNINPVGIELDIVCLEQGQLKLKETLLHRKFKGRIRSLASMPDAMLLLVGTTEGYLQLVNFVDQPNEGLKSLWLRYLGSSVRHLDIYQQDGQTLILALTADSDVFVLDGNGNILWEHKAHTVFLSGSFFKEGKQLYIGITDARGALVVFAASGKPQFDEFAHMAEPSRRLIRDEAFALNIALRPEQISAETFERDHLSSRSRALLLRRLCEYFKNNPEKGAPLLDMISQLSLHELYFISRAELPQSLHKDVVRALLSRLKQPDHRLIFLGKWLWTAARFLEDLVLGLGKQQITLNTLNSEDLPEWGQLDKQITEHPAVMAAVLGKTLTEGSNSFRFSRLLEASTHFGPCGFRALLLLAPSSETTFAHFLVKVIERLGQAQGQQLVWYPSIKELQLEGTTQILVAILELLVSENSEWRQITSLATSAKQKLPNGFEGTHPDLDLLWRMLSPLAMERDYHQRAVAEQLAILNVLEANVPTDRPLPSSPWSSWLEAVLTRFNRIVQIAIGQRRSELQNLRRGLLSQVHLQRVDAERLILNAQLIREGQASPKTRVSLTLDPSTGKLEQPRTYSWLWEQLPVTLQWPLSLVEKEILALEITTELDSYRHSETLVLTIPELAPSKTVLDQAPRLLAEMAAMLVPNHHGWLLCACEEELGIATLANYLADQHSCRLVAMDDLTSDLGTFRGQPLGFHAKALMEIMGAFQREDSSWAFSLAGGFRGVAVFPAAETASRLMQPENRTVLEHMRNAMQTLKNVPVFWLLPWSIAFELQVALGGTVSLLTPFQCVSTAMDLRKELFFWLKAKPAVAEGEIDPVIDLCKADTRLLALWARAPKDWPEFLASAAVSKFMRLCLVGIHFTSCCELILLTQTLTEVGSNANLEEMVLVQDNPERDTWTVRGWKSDTPKSLEPAFHDLLALSASKASNRQTVDRKVLLERGILGQHDAVIYVRQPYFDWLLSLARKNPNPLVWLEDLLGQPLKSLLSLADLMEASDHADRLVPSLSSQGQRILRRLAPVLAGNREITAIEAVIQALVGMEKPLIKPGDDFLLNLPQWPASLSQLPVYRIPIGVQTGEAAFCLVFVLSLTEQELDQLKLKFHSSKVTLVLLGPAVLGVELAFNQHLCALNERTLLEIIGAPDPAHAFGLTLRNRTGLMRFNVFKVGNMLEENSSVFVGRERELEIILGNYRSRSFLILGGRQIGKTSLLIHILAKLKQEPGVTPLYLDCQGITSGQHFVNRLRALFEERNWSWAEHSDSGLTIRQTLTSLTQPVLLLNEIDGLCLWDEPFMQQLRSLSEHGTCQFIMVGYQGAHGGLNNPLHPLFHWVHGEAQQKAIVLGALTQTAARRLVAKLCEPPLDLRWQDDETKSMGEALMLERSHRIPILLQQACYTLVERLDKTRRSVITRQDMEELFSGSYFPAWDYISKIRLSMDKFHPEVATKTLQQYLSQWVLSLAVYYIYEQEELFDHPNLRDLEQSGLEFEVAEIQEYIKRWCGEGASLPVKLGEWFATDDYRRMLDLWCLTVVLGDHPQKVQAYYFTEHLYPIELRAFLKRQALTLEQYLKKQEQYIKDIMSELFSKEATNA